MSDHTGDPSNAESSIPSEQIAIATPQSPVEKQKDLSIEALRGLAILLVLFLHAVNNQATEGYRHFTFSLEYVYMPLFTAISGYVYAMRPVTVGRRRLFLRGKASRILIPFLSVATLQYLVQSVAAGGTSGLAIGQIWRIYLFGYAQFWFLQSLFLIFGVIVLLESAGLLSSLKAMALSLIASAVLSVVVPKIGVVPLDGVVYLLPFFLIGCGMKRFGEALQGGPMVVAAAVLTVGGVCLQQLAYFGAIDVRTDTRSILAVVVGLSVTILLFRWRRNLPVLRNLGNHAYQIYLFHGFGMAFGERLAGLIPHGDGYTVPFLVKVLSGIFCSLAAEAVLVRNVWLRRLFLGQR